MRRLPLFLTESQMITDFTNDADMFSMSCPRFQWIDVILFKWDWKVKTQESAFLRVIRVIRDSDNTHAKNFTHPELQGYLVFGFSDIFFTIQYNFLSVEVSVAKSDMIGHIERDMSDFAPLTPTYVINSQ